MTVYTRGETFSHWITLRNPSSTAKENADAITISIYNPKGLQLVTAQAMVNSATGIYYYNYNIPDTALYGNYRIEVKATLGGDVSIFDDNFILVPWDAINRVREISGIGQEKSISDDALARIILNAYTEVLHEVYTHHYNEKVQCSCSNESCHCSTIICTGFNGSNKTFWTETPYLADYDGNGTVEGWGESTCTDVFVKWKDCDGNCHDGYAVVEDADCGKLTITQDGTAAMPASYAWVNLEYWTRSRYWSEYLMREAVDYLAAHKVLLRFGELERATSADLVNAQNVKYVNPKRMYNEYKRILRKITKPIVGGGQ